MTDLVQTAANVLPGLNAKIDRTGYAGEAITAGQPVYKDSVSGKWKLADNNSATVAAKTASGIALNGASLNQPIDIQTDGDITIGATVTAGDPYYLSGTAGKVCPKADLTTGMNVCMLGLAKSTTVISLAFETPGVTL